MVAFATGSDRPSILEPSHRISDPIMISMQRNIHPWFGELALSIRRRAETLTGLWLGCIYLLAFLVVCAGSAAVVRPEVTADYFAIGLKWIFAWPVQMAVFLAGGAFAFTRSRLISLAYELHTGWWAAVPAKPGATSRVLIVVAGGIAMLTGAVIALVLTLAAIISDSTDVLVMVLTVFEIGMVSGVVLALVAVLRLDQKHRSHRQTLAIKKPMFLLPWLNRCNLALLSEWQRRASLLRWRQGGNFGLIGLVLFVLPSDVPPGPLLGLLTIIVIAAWIGVVMHASVDAARHARLSLGGTPIGAQRFFAASFRYPSIAVGCALTIGTLVIGPYTYATDSGPIGMMVFVIFLGASLLNTALKLTIISRRAPPIL